ncbi:hypothetical protein NCC78_19285 [Micromonospora phytophila]|uniref:hypothetical protein n=1 Tax=Micromonospora phytophila TaxID=709888 RepID=UPI002030ED2D|nr:hypothetical protein [Micromonospora phytophila]MCM0676813.1 hypothetical protein [Micromonospora phytophila]
MRRSAALLGLPLMMIVAGCAPAGSDPAAGPASPASPDQRREAFDQRATEVADAWRPGPAWRTGYVPLQDHTVLVGDPRFTGDTKMAFNAGWYRDQIALPDTAPADGTVRFPDGTLSVPLISADAAYRQLDQGDPPPCAGRPREPGRPKDGPTIEPGPDGPVSSTAQSACIPLTVTAAKLGSVPVRTSRGEAQVPAWLFTVEEISAPVARVAVAPGSVTAVPEVAPPSPSLDDDVAGAQDIRSVDGATLTWQVGVGSCDTGITPLVWERDDVVVLGGGVTRSTGVCNAMLKLEPVTATLKAPLGDRTVLDVVTGAPLTLTGG